MRRFFVGAYALTASLPQSDQKLSEDLEVFRALSAEPSVRGLELPFYQDLREDPREALIEHLPRDWDYVITGLPGVMQGLSREASLGLASLDREQRKQALRVVERMRARVAQIQDHCGRVAVKAVTLHSAPRPPYASAAALRASLEELSQRDWSGADLWLEHCDAYAPGFVKGFLPLNDERSVVKGLPVKISLNWGRSMIETRNAAFVRQQILLLGDALGGFFFSGTAANDALYGAWQDNHSPIGDEYHESWHPKSGLLTLDEIEACVRLLPVSCEVGLKVQPAPSSLSLQERIRFARQQIQLLNKGLSL